MRPPRLLLLLLSFIAFPIFLTLLSLLSDSSADGDNPVGGIGAKSSRLQALFSFHTPVSLFPPSAVISLTDDNSTFFLARPAAFGPSLPNHGLSSQLWVGSGFGDDHKSGSAFEAGGELGCSDVPGWSEGDKKPQDEDVLKGKSTAQPEEGEKYVAAKTGEDATRNGAAGEKSTETKDKGRASPEQDGTDDHLHHPLPESNPAKVARPGQPAEHEPKDKSKTPTHADIQSLQESAEIAGKVVLLSRGGCGFLEKVKWVQRRGGVALIVGDDARGGPLITMYARGDVSNVTIPALFTSYTTAHLLSSLVPAEKPNESNDKKTTPTHEDGPTFTAKSKAEPTKTPGNSKLEAEMQARRAKRSWLARILSFLGWGDGAYKPWHDQEDSRRPPSSGNIDWVLLEDWDEKQTTSTSSIQKAAITTKRASSTRKAAKPTSKSGDDFVIGIQDWRDPDLVPAEKHDVAGESPKVPLEKLGNSGEPEALKGGSITPGSGEYNEADNSRSNPKAPEPERENQHAQGDSEGSKGWLGRFMGDGSEADQKKNDEKQPNEKSTLSPEELVLSEETKGHQGLWVTLTPATMSTSPLFDTLLVLVVSPLVTLTVVYSLLLVRSRIRRRRWRAPKSVVDRLPVRVYHTMTNSSSTTSSQTSSPITSSPASPLLRTSSRLIPNPNRPRSQTASSVLAQTESSAGRSASPSKEKESTASIWRKRYTGRQIECVVCLEEYVDGQSRVMSLPCGHEFHADCM